MPNAATAARRQPEPPADPLTLVRVRADALYRAAVECCRQHDRSARLSSSSDEPELEHEHVDAICRVCDDSLAEMADAYTVAAGSVQPDREEAWWHKANSLWHASREYTRRHADCDDISRKSPARHGKSELGAFQMEYELEASSLLALRHAAEAYRKTRPELR